MTTPRSLRWLLVTVVLIVLFFGLLSTVLFLLIDRTLDRQSKGDDLAACRAAYSVELVSGPTARALKALGTSGVDSPEYQEAIADADPERLEELVRLSRTDPDRFLRECRAGTP